MLDLNVDAASIEDSVCDETDSNFEVAAQEFLGNGGGGGGVDSGASNASSVISAPAVLPDEESNSSDRTIFKFSILNKAKNDGKFMEIEDDSNEDDSGPLGLQKMQLFPVAGDVSSFPLDRTRDWLNLAAPEVVGGEEIAVYDVAGRQVTEPPHRQPPTKRSRRGPRSRSSQYRGVTFYRRTGRWESHIWDCGKQVYLGGFDTAHAAARVYDRAAIKFRGVEADINFHISDYEEDMRQMKNLCKEEFVHVLRRHQNVGLFRGSSKYRGTLPKCGQWEAQMSHVLTKKAFDKSALKCNGREAAVNFELGSHERDSARSCKDGAGRVESLDLNLWVSPSTDWQKKNDISKNIHGQYRASEPLDGKRLKIMVASPEPLNGAMTHGNSVVWSSKNSCFTPKDEERAKSLRLQAMPFPGFSNWSWKVHHHAAIPSVVYHSSAASSGFSSTNITLSPSLVPLNTQNMTALGSGHRHSPVTHDCN